jgi:hypothetical protein
MFVMLAVKETLDAVVPNALPVCPTLAFDHVIGVAEP